MCNNEIQSAIAHSVGPSLSLSVKLDFTPGESKFDESEGEGGHIEKALRVSRPQDYSLRFGVENVGDSYAKYVSLNVEIPLIVAADIVLEWTTQDGEDYVEVQLKNINEKRNIYQPILPTRKFEWLVPVVGSPDVWPKYGLESSVIKWSICADNAKKKSGAINFLELVLNNR